MSKELEALKVLKIKCHPNSNPSPLVDSALEIIEQALQRLEEYDNTVEEFKDLPFEKRLEFFKHDIILMPILEKYQENKKVLNIIKKKRVNVNQLLLCWKVEMYNSRCRKGYELSKEEFDLLKRYLCQNE